MASGRAQGMSAAAPWNAAIAVTLVALAVAVFGCTSGHKVYASEEGR